MEDRYHYASTDGSEIVETIQRKDRSEFVNTITLQPKESQASRLCEKKVSEMTGGETSHLTARRSCKLT